VWSQSNDASARQAARQRLHVDTYIGEREGRFPWPLMLASPQRHHEGQSDRMRSCEKLTEGHTERQSLYGRLAHRLLHRACVCRHQWALILSAVVTGDTCHGSVSLSAECQGRGVSLQFTRHSRRSRDRMMHRFRSWSRHGLKFTARTEHLQLSSVPKGHSSDA
jgi:hypothetical protein